jgi:hypothetical protein
MIKTWMAIPRMVFVTLMKTVMTFLKLKLSPLVPLVLLLFLIAFILFIVSAIAPLAPFVYSLI